MWRLWAKALGEKSGSNNSEADKVAAIRSAIVIFELIVGVFIILNAIQNHGLGLIGL